MKTNNRSAVLKLLALGADPNIQNSRGITPLSAAAHNGRIDIIVDLVNYGASVNNQNASGSTPLIQVMRRSVSGVLVLILAFVGFSLWPRGRCACPAGKWQ